MSHSRARLPLHDMPLGLMCVAFVCMLSACGGSSTELFGANDLSSNDLLAVTFDQPMVRTGFDVGSAPGAPPLACLKTPRLLDDAKTFVLLCTSEPHKTYNLTFNAKPQGGFESAAEQRADPATLSFKTTDGDGAEDIHTAMKNASLRPIDVPIQDTPELPPEPGKQP